MNNKTEIQQELNEFGVNIPVVGMPEMSFPNRYFEDFHDKLIEKIELNGLIDAFPQNTPYQVAPNYFEDFSSSIINQIKEDSFLSSLPKNIPYQLEADYFSTFHDEIVNNVKFEKSSQLYISSSSKWISKLALAATVLLFMGLAFKGLISSDIQSNSRIQVEHELAKISDSDIQLYLQQHAEEIETSLVLSNYDESNIDLKKLETEVLDQTLNKISDEELKQYTF